MSDSNGIRDTEYKLKYLVDHIDRSTVAASFLYDCFELLVSLSVIVVWVLFNLESF